MFDTKSNTKQFLIHNLIINLSKILRDAAIYCMEEQVSRKIIEEPKSI